MKKIIILIFTLISISATAQEVEVEILNDILVELIGQENYLKPIAPPPPPVPSDSIIKLNPSFWTEKTINKHRILREKYDSIRRNRQIDDRKLVVFFKEKFEVDTVELKNWTNDILETSSSLAESDFVTFLNYKSINVNISELKKTGRFTLEKFSDRKLYSTTDKVKIIGQVILSRAYLNKQKNEGFLFYTYYFDRNHSFTNLVFIVKSNEKWKIRKTELVAIS